MRASIARTFHSHYGRLRGFPHHHILAGLEALNSGTEADLQSWQQARLLERLKFWYERIPFYRRTLDQQAASAGATVGRLIEEMSSNRSLDYLPLMTKQSVTTHFDELIVTGADIGRSRRNHTGGSTGEVFFFLQNQTDAAWLQAGVALFRGYLDLNMGSRTAQIWGSSIEAKQAGSMRQRIQTWLANTQFHSTYNLKREQRQHIVKAIARWNPELIIGYPSSLSAFLEDLRELPQGTFSRLKAIWSASETLLPGHREDLENAFGARVFNNYGCREFGPLAMECQAHEGLHLNEGACFFEFLPVGDDLFELVITDLKNDIMPLIRYRIGDLVRGMPGTCSCGRTTRVIRGLEGRSFDLIKGSNGEVVTGTFWTLLLRSRPGVRRFQVIQEELDRFVIRLETGDAFQEEYLRFWEDAIQGQFTDPVRIEWRRNEAIEQLPSGKFRFIQSRVKHA